MIGLRSSGALASSGMRMVLAFLAFATVAVQFPQGAIACDPSTNPLCGKDLCDDFFVCPPPAPRPKVTWTKAGPIVTGVGIVVGKVGGAVNITYNGVRPARVVPGELVAAPGNAPKETLMVDGKFFTPTGASAQQVDDDYQGGCADLNFCYNAETRDTYRRDESTAQHTLHGIYVNITPKDQGSSNKRYDFWYTTSIGTAKSGRHGITLENRLEAGGSTFIAELDPAGTVQDGASSTVSLQLSVAGVSIGKSWTGYEGKIAGDTVNDFHDVWAAWGGDVDSNQPVALRSMAVFEGPSVSDTCIGFQSFFKTYSSPY